MKYPIHPPLLLLAFAATVCLTACAPEKTDAPTAIEETPEAAAPTPQKELSIWDAEPTGTAPAAAESATMPAAATSIWDAESAKPAAQPAAATSATGNSMWDAAPDTSLAAPAASSPSTAPAPTTFAKAEPKPRTENIAYPGEVITWLGDMESMDYTPNFSTNSGATGVVTQDAASGNRLITVTKIKAGVSALLINVEAEDVKNATGLAFSIKGNNEETIFDPTVTLTSPTGKQIFIDPNFRAGENAIKLNSDEWQTVYVAFKDYGLESVSASKISQLGFFFFGPATNLPILLDDIALVRVEADAIEIEGAFTDAPIQPSKLFFTQEDFPALREKIRNNPTLTQVYQRVQKRAEGFMQLPADPYRGMMAGEGKDASTQGRQMHSHVLTTAFVGFIDDNPDYIQHAVDMYISAIDQLGPVDVYLENKIPLQVGDMALPVMIGYDWLNPYMTDAQRLRAKKAVFQYAEWIYKMSPVSTWGEDIYQRETSNWNVVMHSPVGLASLLIEGHPEWEALGTRKVDGYLKYTTDADGVPHESGAYLSLGSSAAYSYIEALKRIKGIDLLAPHKEQLAGTIQYFAHALNPWGAGSLNINQGDAGPDKVPWFLELGNYLNEPLAYWVYYRLYGDKATYGGNNTWGTSSHDIHKSNGVFIILAWNDSIGVTSPQEAGLPLAREFTTNQAIARTGWDDNAALLSFKSDEVWGGWSHADDNSFIFMAFGEGIAGDPGAHYYHARQHNAILIDGKGQAYIGPGHDVGGKITQFEDKGNYVLMTGDATEAYTTFVTGAPHLPAEKVIRKLCFIREPQPMLLIIDQIAMQDDAEHDYSVMMQYGRRHQPSEMVLQPEVATIFSQTKSKTVKSMTRVLWPQSGLTIKERPDIENTMSTVEISQRTADATFVSIIIPEPVSSSFPTVTSTGDPESGMFIDIKTDNAPIFTVEIKDGSFSNIQ